jgi:hypothetical protein
VSNSNDFLFPRHPYRGRFSPESLAFNANLQEFSQRIDYIVALQTGNKMAPEEAYKQIKTLWKQLKRSRKEMGIGGNTPPG